MESDFDLSQHNTFALHSVATYGCIASSIYELEEARLFAHSGNLPLLVLGQGSNIILPERVNACVVVMNLRGIDVISDTGKFDVSDDEEVIVKAAAGESWHKLILWTLEQHLYGLENLSLIPGTVGASPVQNIGAYGVELSDVCCAVEIMLKDSGKIITLNSRECDFSYRNSIFKKELKNKAIVTGLYIKLSKVFHPRLNYESLEGKVLAAAAGKAHGITARLVSDTVCQIRSERLPDPENLGNVGSFFHNPFVSVDCATKLIADYPDLPVWPVSDNIAKLPAAWLIDFCGFKGKTFNSVGVYKKQALVLTNLGGADYDQIMAAVSEIRKAVLDRFDIELHIEPEILHKDRCFQE